MAVMLLLLVTVFYASCNLLLKTSGTVVPPTATTTIIATLSLEIATYTASKSGLQGLVREFAVEFGEFSVRVNALALGFIAT